VTHRARYLCVALAGVLASTTGAQASETRPGEATRTTALVVLREHVTEPERLAHAMAIEAIMRALAREVAGDEEEWGLAGLLHDVDRSQTDSNPAQHGIVGARLLAELGFSDAVVRAVETHDDVAGRPRTLPIAHALYSADQTYWAILSSGVPLDPGEEPSATPADVVQALRRAGKEDRIDDRLRRECAAIGLTLDDVLRSSLDSMRTVQD